MLSATDTTRTTLYDQVDGLAWPEGIDGRCINNELVQEYPSNHVFADDEVQPMRARITEAIKHKDPSTHVVWAGQGVRHMTSCPSVAEVFSELSSELMI